MGFEERLDSHKGPIACCILSKQFYETDASRGFVRGYNMQIVRGSGPLGTAMAGFASGTIPWGKGHHEAFAKQFDHVAAIGIVGEDLPEEHNRVTLDPELGRMRCGFAPIGLQQQLSTEIPEELELSIGPSTARLQRTARLRTRVRRVTLRGLEPRDPRLQSATRRVRLCEPAGDLWR